MYIEFKNNNILLLVIRFSNVDKRNNNNSVVIAVALQILKLESFSKKNFKSYLHDKAKRLF